MNETMGTSDRAGAKRGRPATEPEEDGRAAQRRQVEVSQLMVLGATEWLGDEHIHEDYNRLARDLRQTYPGLAAQTSFVPPAVVKVLINTEAEDLQETLRGLYVNDAGQEQRFLFLPVNNANNSAASGTHWSLLFVDRQHPQGQQAIHYDSLPGSGQGVIARNLARKLEEEIRYQEGQMAQQVNGYDCGVSVLEATRELVTRLANSQPRERASLDLRSVVADRTALLARHGARPAIALEEGDRASNLKPKRRNQSKGARADALKAANPALSAAQIRRTNEQRPHGPGRQADLPSSRGGSRRRDRAPENSHISAPSHRQITSGMDARPPSRDDVGSRDSRRTGSQRSEPQSGALLRSPGRGDRAGKRSYSTLLSHQTTSAMDAGSGGGRDDARSTRQRFDGPRRQARPPRSDGGSGRRDRAPEISHTSAPWHRQITSGMGARPPGRDDVGSRDSRRTGSQRSEPQSGALLRSGHSRSHGRTGDSVRPPPRISAAVKSANLLKRALSEIAYAPTIVEFSKAVVGRSRELQGQPKFLQKASDQFTQQFLPNWERDIKNSFAFANVCNVVSRGGGKVGKKACKAMGAELSKTARALNEVDALALQLFALSFSRYPGQADCRDGMVRIAEFYSANSDLLCQLDSQNVSLLVNGFAKWPKEPGCGRGTFAVAREVLRRAERHGLSKFDPQNLTNLVNGFSKWPARAECGRGTSAVAREVLRRAGELRLFEFNPQNLTNLVNGFSKWPDEQKTREATVAIAGAIADGKLDGFWPQQLANLVNGFSKWPKQPGCGRGTLAVAREVLRRAGEHRLFEFNPQDLTNLVNGFSKWPDEQKTREATVAIAGAIADGKLDGFWPQALANLVNGFAKWPDEQKTREATVAIAGAIADGKLDGFLAQELANLVNGFSKWPAQAECGRGTLAVAREVLRRAGEHRLFEFDLQGLTNLVNGFSKWPDEQKTREATVTIAGAIADGKLDGFLAQELANLVNGFSKWPAQAECGRGTLAVAREVLRRAGEHRLFEFNPQNLTNLVNGFSKWPDEQKTREATVTIAGAIADGKLDGFWPQAVANLVNGFAKWPQEPECYQALVEIARELGSKRRSFNTFSTLELARIASGLSRGIEEGETAGEVAEPALLKNPLRQLAHYLYAEKRLQQADVHAIASIFKALGKAQLLDDLGALAQPGLDRLEVLLHAPGFELDNNLETMGNLCAALLPLARATKPVLRGHRKSALNLLNAIQPVVELKIEAHLKAGQSELTSGANASRCPALSIYLVLKTRAVLEALYQRPYVDGDELVLRGRQEELHGKTRQILDSARALIEADLPYMSWNVIAEIEAEGPLEAFDTFMAQNAPSVPAHHAAASFDVHRVLQAMDHEPRPPRGHAGLMRLPVVDIQGRPLASEAELRYSIFHRLTSGAVKVVEVQLPANLSAFMLTRTFTVEGVPYRMDLFGGSKMKAPQKSLTKLASRQPIAAEKAPGGKLLAIPDAETAPGTAFEQLSRAWAPFKEAYYYTQRRGFAAPPGIPDVGPHDYALEGCFKLSLLPDRPAGAVHPFRFEGRDGEIALRPHDGCGFIRASLAERMPAIARARHDAPERVPAFADKKHSAVPASALQHYPRSVAVAQETREKALAWLKTHQSPTAEELFRLVTSGHIDGPSAVAVPSSDGCLHVPTGKSKTLTRDAGVLVGRSPYDKPNLRPFAADRVRSARDPTAAFLDRCVAFQYSFNVAHRSGAGLAADDPTFFAKGILIVVPDEMWPADFAERGVVMSAEDVKCHSRWLEEKDRVKADTALECVGILQATEVFAPGSLVAVPSAEQKKLDGDFDGDTVVIIGDRPHLYQHVRQFDAQQARGIASMKPPKSHTPAIEKGSYQFSRSRQILSATQNVLQTYSCLQRSLLAQPLEAQRWFAERAVFGTYEGIHHELMTDIRALLQEDRPDGQTLHELIARAGEDSKAARHPVARELAALLVAELQDWNKQLNSETAHEQSDVKQQLARSVASTGAKPAVSPDAGALFPELSESYPTTADARERVEFLLDHYKPRIDPRPDGYEPGDLRESAINLLSIGIKVGTDAYKSDTGACVFMQKGAELRRLLERIPGLKSVPYVKAQAAKLHQGRFDVDGSLADLKDNPTLAASVMEASIMLACERRLLPSRAPAARLAEGERPPGSQPRPLDLGTLAADPQPLLAGSNARAELASSTRSRKRSNRGR
ncbi:hypothetical protein GR247_37440 [Rhizobium leguminosarum]|nr:hypothetical protein [Rhizobium leguminosarum]